MSKFDLISLNIRSVAARWDVITYDHIKLAFNGIVLLKIGEHQYFSV